MNTHDKLNLIKLYITLYSTRVEYIFFSSAQESITKIDHTLCYKTNLIPIIQSLFSDHSGIKLKINNIKIIGKFQKTSKLNKGILIHPLIKEVKREIRNYFELNENRNTKESM